MARLILLLATCLLINYCSAEALENNDVLNENPEPTPEPEGEGTQATPTHCTHNGKTIKEGQMFVVRARTTRARRFCVCRRGLFHCLRVAPLGSCRVRGHYHLHGSYWQRKDECKLCRCRYGFATCYKHNCQGCVDDDGTEYEPLAAKKVECNACICLNGEFMCSERYCYSESEEEPGPEEPEPESTAEPATEEPEPEEGLEPFRKRAFEGDELKEWNF